MSDPSLLQQLLNRTTLFRNQFPNITQAQIAKHIGVQESNFSAALAGRVGLNADSVIRLHNLFNLSKRDVQAVFSKPVLSGQILKLQEKGKALKFDNSGWIAKEGSDADPVNSTDIANTPKAQRESVNNLLAVLGALDNVTRKTVIAAILEAYPNPNGTTANNGQRFSR